MIHHRSGGVLAAIFSAIFLAPAPGCAQGASSALILTDATVLPMTGAAPLRDQTIVIEQGRITGLGPSASIRWRSGSRVISLGGKTVMPGLADMHVHNIVRDRWRLLGHGITAVRGMWGVPSHALLRDSVARGKAMGPWITLASPGLDARPGFWPLTQFVDSLGDVVPTVRRLKGEGWAWLKIYSRLPLGAYDSIVATARALGIPFLGHVPWAVPVEHALEAGQLTIEHLSGYDMALNHFADPPGTDSTRMLELVRATVRAGTWNCPTLAIIAEFARRGPGPDADRVIANRRRMVRALYQSGARLLIGTDSGIDVVPAGSALNDEMREFVAAGVPVDTVLRIATRDAARFLGQSNQWGAVAVGMRADLLVLDQDPTHHLETLKSPAALVLHGNWVPADTLARWRER